jgi:hypothetical protein
MFASRRYLVPLATLVLLGGCIVAGEKKQSAEKVAQDFVLRADEVLAIDDEPVLLKLTLIYLGDKPLRIDYPIDGMCQPGNGQPPWVWITTPAGWKEREDAYKRAHPEVDNSLHSGSVTLKRGQQFSTTISLQERFSQIPLGRSSIRVTWPVYDDPESDNRSSSAIAEPTVTVPVAINPRIVRKNSHDSESTKRSKSQLD